jgi:hypothetical protein
MPRNTLHSILIGLLFTTPWPSPGPDYSNDGEGVATIQRILIIFAVGSLDFGVTLRRFGALNDPLDDGDRADDAVLRAGDGTEVRLADHLATDNRVGPAVRRAPRNSVKSLMPFAADADFIETATDVYRLT